MHEMQTIVTDDRGVRLSVCLSVCLSCGSIRLHCAKMAELFPGSSRNIVIPPQRSEWGILLNFGTPLVFPERLKLETRNVHIEGTRGGLTKTMQKSVTRRSGAGSRDLPLTSATPTYLKNGYS